MSYNVFTSALYSDLVTFYVFHFPFNFFSFFKSRTGFCQEPEQPFLDPLVSLSQWNFFLVCLLYAAPLEFSFFSWERAHSFPFLHYFTEEKSIWPIINCTFLNIAFMWNCLHIISVLPNQIISLIILIDTKLKIVWLLVTLSVFWN